MRVASELGFYRLVFFASLAAIFSVGALALIMLGASDSTLAITVEAYVALGSGGLAAGVAANQWLMSATGRARPGGRDQIRRLLRIISVASACLIAGAFALDWLYLGTGVVAALISAVACAQVSVLLWFLSRASERGEASVPPSSNQ